MIYKHSLVFLWMMANNGLNVLEDRASEGMSKMGTMISLLSLCILLFLTDRAEAQGALSQLPGYDIATDNSYSHFHPYIMGLDNNTRATGALGKMKGKHGRNTLFAGYVEASHIRKAQTGPSLFVAPMISMDFTLAGGLARNVWRIGGFGGDFSNPRTKVNLLAGVRFVQERSDETKMLVSGIMRVGQKGSNEISQYDGYMAPDVEIGFFHQFGNLTAYLRLQGEFPLTERTEEMLPSHPDMGKANVGAYYHVSDFLTLMLSAGTEIVHDQGQFDVAPAGKVGIIGAF